MLILQLLVVKLARFLKTHVNLARLLKDKINLAGKSRKIMRNSTRFLRD